MMLRFHTQTGGSTLTAQQPDNNIVRVAIQTLAAVLGGTQSLHTNSRDEALALPTEDSVRIALRTQQIVAYESGVADSIDPLGGSYYVERMTDELQAAAEAYIEKIDAMGGAVKAIEQGYIQREIAESSYQYQRQVESGEQIVVGVNKFTIEEPPAKGLLGGGQPDQEAAGDEGGPGQRTGAPAAGRPAHGGGGQRQPDALYSGLRQGVLHRRRNLRRAAQGVRRIPSDGGALR